VLDGRLPTWPKMTVRSPPRRSCWPAEPLLATVPVANSYASRMTHAWFGGR
jgi:hypothetical protein